MGSGSYSWSSYDTLLNNAVATNCTVTVTVTLTSSRNWLIDGSVGQVKFLWGNGNTYSNDTVLGITNITVGNPTPTVPVPAAVWLFGSGLLALTAFARRKQA